MNQPSGKRMRAFITGASGFIGTHLLNELLSQGWEVRVIIHKHPLPPHKGLEVVSGDLADRARLEKYMTKANVVFHLASALGSSLISNGEFQTINAGGTESVLRAASEAGVRTVIHFSSAGVLGHVPEMRPVDESYPSHPLDAYDRSKLEGERIALEYGRRGLDVRIIRPGWVYGPGDRRTLKLIRAVAHKRILMVSSGATLQTPVYVDDLVKGTLQCLSKGRRAEIYHLAGPESLSVKDMIHTIAGAAGVTPPRFRLPLKAAEAAAWTLDRIFRTFHREAPLTPSRLAFFIRSKPLAIGKAARELGYSPRVDFARGIAKTIAWYRNKGWL
jgi:nucleoside-diphosphate-sugar epimerase